MKGRRGPALAALGALLDRSLVQIKDAAADGRRFDRQLPHAVTDVRDNTTFPLFRAAAADTSEEREQDAPAALEWMACFGVRRRAWMVEQATAAGHTGYGTGQAASAHLPEHQPPPHVRRQGRRPRLRSARGALTVSKRLNRSR